MIREVFSIGSIGISPFGLALVAAFITAYLQLARGLKRLSLGNEEDASAMLFAAGIGGIAGGKIYYAALYRDWHLLLDRSGLVWYGGFLLASVLVLWTMRRRRLPLWPTLDAASLGLALGYGVGRIGCFLVGDDYGVPTNLPWGVAFPVGLPPTTAGELRQYGVPAEIPDDALVRVHPTQLYETGLAVLIWWLGQRYLARQLAAGKSGYRAGSTALLVLGLLAVERFGIEFLRAKDDRFLGPLTLAQAISLGILVTILILASRRSEAGPPTVER